MKELSPSEYKVYCPECKKTKSWLFDGIDILCEAHHIVVTFIKRGGRDEKKGN
jgi:hypothetical protein